MAKKKKKTTKRKKKKSVKKPDLRLLAYPDQLNENKVIEELRATVEKLKVFDALGKTLTSCLELEEILQLVVSKFGDLVETQHLGLVLLDSASNQFQFHYPKPSDLKHQGHRIGQGLIGKCLENGRAKLYHDPQTEKNFDPKLDGLILKNPKSMICLPIISKGVILGALIFATEQGAPSFNPEQLTTLETFSDYLAIAVENASNYQKVQDLTITDDLTQLYNSRYLPVVLEREIARARRYNEDVSLVFLDLDNFKSVNDEYGHLAGSTLLTEFGDFLYHQIRTTDIGIRYGGDEFVLVLPRTSKTDAIRVVERAIEDLHTKVFLQSKGLNIPLTASFGIATFPEDTGSIDGLIAAADKAMYEVKKTSKDGLFAINAKVSSRS